MSVKKGASGRRSAPEEVQDPGGAQAPADRQAAEAHLRALIDTYAAPHLGLIEAARQALRKRLPTSHELVYEYRDFIVISFSPNEHGYEGVLALHANASGVKLYFNRGKELPDPAKLLQGSGKLVRSIDLEGASTLVRPEVKTLIEEAIARNPLPFAPTGTGSVILRSATANKPSRPTASKKAASKKAAVKRSQKKDRSES